jgi:hypothetical protein
MGIEDFILRLRIKFGNKLSEKIANSSRAQKKKCYGISGKFLQ